MGRLRFGGRRSLAACLAPALLGILLIGCAALPGAKGPPEAKVMTVPQMDWRPAMSLFAAQRRAAVQTVTADRLYTIYSQNLIEGALPNQRFLGREIVVEGSFAGWGQDRQGMKVMELGTHDADAFVYAQVSQAAEAALAGVVVGHTVRLQCVGEGASAGSPMLGECRGE